MVAEFTVVRDGVRNWIDVPLGAVDRAINVSATGRTGTGAIFTVATSSVGAGPGNNYAVFDVTGTFTGYYDYYLFRVTYNPQNTAASQTLCLMRVDNGPQWAVTNQGVILYGLYMRIYDAPAGTVGAIPQPVYVLYGDEGGAAPPTVSSIKPYENKYFFYVANRISSYYGFDQSVEYYASQNSADNVLINSYMKVRSPAVVTGSLSGHSVSISVQGGAAVTGDIYGCHLFGFGIGGTLNGTLYGYFISSDDVGVITGSYIGYYVQWHNQRITGLSGYAAGFDSDIRMATTAAYPFYGTHHDFEGVMGAGSICKGYYANFNAVTCGAGQTLYGLDLDMGTMGVGGTIAGIHCIVPNLTPAMVLGDGVGVLTVNFGANSHPNIDSSTGRIYFGTQAGGSGAADDIYCKNVLQTAPWAENTWDSIDDIKVLMEINNAIFEKREPVLPEVFRSKYQSEGYYDRLQMDALERGAILRLAGRVEKLEVENRELRALIGRTDGSGS